jgi:hypothetical protein
MKSKVKSKVKEKQKLIEEIWRIRREEQFSNWSDVKKRLKLV